ncbi:hypothetical protein HAX54_044319 [Datura stramonium]|uniref:Uncharacterized protein n=1 Tax=Datura stramonium TaxID=4076 RepID=A0ABS8SP17_DATST|nr:hypothetical protein [Datura stramonium]
MGSQIKKWLHLCHAHCPDCPVRVTLAAVFHTILPVLAIEQLLLKKISDCSHSHTDKDGILPPYADQAFYSKLFWPPALCDQKRSCCYPTTGKPALDFGIHGLWPNYNNGSYPSNCNRTTPYDETEIEDLISSMQENWPTLACPKYNGTKFWSHEWAKHGTCSLSTLDEHSYFEAALTIKEKVNLLSVLEDAGIEPGGFYSLEAIKEAIKNGTGHEAAIQCNKDAFVPSLTTEQLMAQTSAPNSNIARSSQ